MLFACGILSFFVKNSINIVTASKATALRMAKTCFENFMQNNYTFRGSNFVILIFASLLNGGQLIDPFLTSGLFGSYHLVIVFWWIFSFLLYFAKNLEHTNSEKPDQLPHTVASKLCVHC